MQITAAEAFTATADLHALILPGDIGAPHGDAPYLVWIVTTNGADWRVCRISGPPGAIAFAAFRNDARARFNLFVTADGPLGSALPPAFATQLASRREPIVLGAYQGDVPALPPLPPRSAWQIAGGRLRTAETPRFESGLGTYWRDQFGLHASGWAHCYAVPIRTLGLAIGPTVADLPLHPMPDVIPHYPECGDTIPVGWSGYVDGPPGVPAELVVGTDRGAFRQPLAVPDRLSAPSDPTPEYPPAKNRFVAAVNEGRLHVLELGARVVGPDAVDWRARMPHAASYRGLDIHPSPHVDIIGDAHRLTDYIAPGSLDAIWSGDVFEHLRLPWLAAAEVNRALRMGGITYHNAPHTWPLHELPADYWRFSDGGLRMLFGPAFGFEVLDAGLIEHVRVYPMRRTGPWREMPVFPSFGHAYILSRKVAELPAAGALETWWRERVGASTDYPDTDRAAREKIDA